MVQGRQGYHRAYVAGGSGVTTLQWKYLMPDNNADTAGMDK